MTTATAVDTRPVRLTGRRAGQRSIEARNELVMGNLNFARLVVHRAGTTGGEQEDELQEAYLGAVEAIGTYDESRGAVTTHLERRVRGRLVEHRAYSRLCVRLPHGTAKRLAAFHRTRRTLEQAHGREPSFAEVCNAMGLGKGQRDALRDAVAAERASERAESITCDNREDDPQGHSPATSDPSPLDVLAGAEEVSLLADALTDLAVEDPRMAQAVRLRYGIGGAEPLSHPDIAVRIGCCRELARQTVLRGLSRLRELLEARGVAA